MKLQRTPVALLLAALLLGAIVYIHESDNSAQQKSTQSKIETKLFPFKEDEIQTINLQTSTQTLAFTRTAAEASPNPQRSPASPSEASPSPQASPASPSPKPPGWTMTTPKKTAANNATIAFLLNLMATGNSQQTIVVPPAKQAEFGLDKPIATIEVKRLNQQTHRLILGKPNFNRSALYALVDPTPGAELSVRLVSIDFENAITRSVAEWQNEPKPN
ncbi:MAG TPA: DUF4340 domain-containing protein [Thermosynechococcaceae cyanobacterium]